MTSTHLVNRLPSQTLAFTSPIDRLHAAFPGISLRTGLLPRIFGCTAYVHDSSGSQTKLDARALRCVFVSYSSLQKGYKCYHPSSRRFFVSANVTFAEYEPFFGVCSTSSRLSIDEVPLTSPLVPLSPLGSPEPSSSSSPPTSSPPLEPVVERRVDPPPSTPSLLPSDELASPPSGYLPSSSSGDLLTSPPADLPPPHLATRPPSLDLSLMFLLLTLPHLLPTMMMIYTGLLPSEKGFVSALALPVTLSLIIFPSIG